MLIYGTNNMFWERSDSPTEIRVLMPKQKEKDAWQTKHSKLFLVFHPLAYNMTVKEFIPVSFL